MKQVILFLSMMAVTFSFSSCAAIGDIFKAGVWVGVIVVVAVIALIFFLIRGRSNKN
jgi:uncharacterized membrane protein YkvI